MNKKTISLLGIIILFFALVALYSQYINHSSRQEANQIQMQEKINGVYFNERFGYEITCENSWYIWPYFSREMAMVKQTRLRDLINFRQKWTVEDSEILFLTNSKQEDLSLFFDKDGLINIANLPKGRWIQIFPIDIDPDLEKEKLTEKGILRIEVKTITLQSGLKVQQVDTRTLPSGTLSILAPYNFDSKLDSGKQAMSLNFVTDAEVGSDSEKAFYEIVNSLSFR